MAAKVGINLDKSSMKQAQGILDQIDELVRGPAISNALRNVGNQIKSDVRSVLPKPGYPGDKPQFKPLRDSLLVRVKNYNNGATKVLVTGYAWPAGAHGQPLEAGHEKYLWGEHIDGSPVDPKPYMAEIVEKNGVRNSQALIEGARRALAKAKGNG